MPTKTYLRWLSLSALVILLDQITKIAADNLLQLHRPVELIPSFFNFTLAYNPGAAFSFLSDAGGWQRWFFTALSAAVSVALIIWIGRLQQQERWLSASLSLILGGAIGNLIDRVLYGHVVDFLDFYFGSYHFPAFNLADSAITIGAVILIILQLVESREEKPT